jgi:hypothetical protein
MNHEYLILSLIPVVLGISWLAGMLRALYFYFRWLRLLRVWLRCLVILGANIGPLVCLSNLSILEGIGAVPAAIVFIFSCLCGVCMLLYLSVCGFAHTVLIYISVCKLIARFWGGLRPWHKVLLIAVPLDMVLWKLFF